MYFKYQVWSDWLWFCRFLWYFSFQCVDRKKDLLHWEISVNNRITNSRHQVEPMWWRSSRNTDVQYCVCIIIDGIHWTRSLQTFIWRLHNEIYVWKIWINPSDDVFLSPFPQAVPERHGLPENYSKKQGNQINTLQPWLIYLGSLGLKFTALIWSMQWLEDCESSEWPSVLWVPVAPRLPTRTPTLLSDPGTAISATYIFISTHY